MDLHIHTPASKDYQEPHVSYLDILRRAETRALSIIAFTDHNTVAGYRRMRDEIESLELLERLNRALPEERERLKEYRRLLSEILVLPGFEFTATFGFHILALFPPNKPLREIEHILLSLNIPSDQLDDGSSTVGATADVLTAYRTIDMAGGIAIAAHANSTNGVAMRGFGFGGQTKIAYTQDPHLAALEVTDLELKGRRSTAGFFNGTKPEYPRRMHCIQGSDAHRLKLDPASKKNLGVGDRATDVLLPEIGFDELRDLFRSNDFARARPHRAAAEETFDFIQQAREEGSSIVQAFHDSMTQRGGRLYDVLSDICAFANTNGGTIYIGVSGNPKERVEGVGNPQQAVQQLQREIGSRISPGVDCTVDTKDTHGKTVIRVLVPRGDDPPYALDDNKIYIREEAETGLAVRDEIVGLVMRRVREQPAAAAAEPSEPPARTPVPEDEFDPGERLPVELAGRGAIKPPRTGVEIVASEERDGTTYHTVRDLRNGSTVKNVTRTSARRLWHYAILEHEKQPDLSNAPIVWSGDIGLLKKYEKAGVTRYDLVQRHDGNLRVYYGVTEDGIHGEWKRIVGGDEDRETTLDAEAQPG